MSLTSLFDRLLSRPAGAKTAANTAKDRLRLVLMHDRTDLPATTMEAIRADIVAVLSKYVDLDESACEVMLEKDEGSTGLVLNVPIRRVKTDAEAEEARAHAHRVASASS